MNLTETMILMLCRMLFSLLLGEDDPAMASRRVSHRESSGLSCAPASVRPPLFLLNRRLELLPLYAAGFGSVSVPAVMVVTD